MVVRVWRASATRDGSERYRRHFECNVLPELKELPGFRKAYLLTHESGDTVHIEVHTHWDSLETIRAFAFPVVDAAVVEREAREALTAFDTTVTHFSALEYVP